VFSIIVVLVLILQGSLSMYAGANTGISIINALRPDFADIKASVRIRATALIAVGFVCFWVGLAYTGNFGTVFGDTLSVILILLIPWSAVNLTDFYLVRKGHYVTTEIFKPDGIYGRFNTAGLVSFFLALACELLFTNLGFYVSPVASLLSGGDISWLVGVVVAGGSYLLLAPRFGSAEVRRSGAEQLTSSRGI
jgi:NCS1 family nucleobase:cation symporter-1